MERENFGSQFRQFIANVLSAERDYWEVYEQVIPSKRPKSSRKENGKN